jgi:O-antigen biosynthesis protein
LDHDDFLWPNALFEVISVLQNKKYLDFIYTDEDKIEENGKTHSDCFFKPDISPDYLRSCNYITHFVVIRKKLVEKVGGFRTRYDGTQDWDLFLRITREIGFTVDKAEKIFHIPKILYSWRKSETSAASEKVAKIVKGYAFLNQRKALEDDLKNSEYTGDILSLPYLSYWRVKYKILSNPLVSIILLHNRSFSDLTRSLESIQGYSSYKNIEILIVTDKNEGHNLKKLNNYTKFRIIQTKEGSSKAENYNKVVKETKGEHIIFFESGIKVLAKDWIEAMLEHSQRTEIGVVSGKTINKDGTVNHAGVIVDSKANVQFGMDGYFDKTPQSYPMVFSKDVVRNMLAFSNKVLMVKKSTFNKVGGFDNAFVDDYFSIDFCFKVFYKAYLFNLFTPFSLFEISSSQKMFSPEGKKRFAEKWSDISLRDPFYNENLTLLRNDFSLHV